MRVLISFLSFSLGVIAVLSLYAESTKNKKGGKMDRYKKLTEDEIRVIKNKGTEAPFSGKYNSFYEEGVYHCKQCGATLYSSESKFNSGCGWPAFDDEIEGAIKRVPDADGKRIEIICANCGAHLGHVFEGEGFTEKDTRHCVNSISLTFTPKNENLEKAYFAGGCFWGVEYYFEKQKGVKSAISGYIGGGLDNPTYKDVSTGKTGHFEAVEITYNPSEVSYEELAKLFFEIHDPTQKNGQGPDIGNQYLSAVFYVDNNQKDSVEKLIDILKSKKYDVSTKLIKASKFYPAEDYHQDYYEKTGKTPYCHSRVKRF